MKLLIVLQHRFDLWNPPSWFAERLRTEFPQLEVVHLKNYEGAEQHLADADILISWSIRPEQFAAARRLRWIHSPAAAVHGLMIPEVIASDVVVTNARQVHGPVVAEHVMAVLLALGKRLPSAFRMQQQHLWGQQQLWDEQPRPREIAGATLGLIGVGSIGAEVARRALVFGMNILAVREHPEKGSDYSFSSASSALRFLGPADLDEVLSNSDYVVLAAPLTPKTHDLINAARLARMRPDSYLINVSRGALIDEAALAGALRHRRLAGAALDVFEREPLPAGSPLWDVPNLLITPHSAALTDKLWERHYALLAENLQRFFSGQPLTSMVDKQRGY